MYCISSPTSVSCFSVFSFLTSCSTPGSVDSAAMANPIFQESFWLSIELFCFDAIQCLVLDTRMQPENHLLWQLALAWQVSVPGWVKALNLILPQSWCRMGSSLSCIASKGVLQNKPKCNITANRREKCNWKTFVFQEYETSPAQSTECSSSGCLVARVVPARFGVGNPADD